MHREEQIMAIKATFSPTARLLTEFGDSLDNAIVTSRDAAGQILVNGGGRAHPGRHSHRR
jgi:hypothetical protein